MTKKTQCEMVLDMLQKGPITALDVAIKVKCLTCAERIRDLRERGYNIHTTMHEGLNGKRYAIYRLLRKKKGVK
jgi:hypothetical protein